MTLVMVSAIVSPFAYARPIFLSHCRFLLVQNLSAGEGGKEADEPSPKAEKAADIA